jgi:RHS repeat-associated protein/uncharacterized delta-60 repeat protein
MADISSAVFRWNFRKDAANDANSEPQRIDITFSAAVTGIDPSDFSLANLLTGQSIAVTSSMLTTTSTTASISLRDVRGANAGYVADGNYELAVSKSGIYSASNNAPLGPANSEFLIRSTDPAPGSASQFPDAFHFLAGDYNHDRQVNFDDLLIQAANYNTINKRFGPSSDGSYSEAGDANYDSVVDFGDLLTVSANYNRYMRLPPTGANALTAQPGPSGSVLLAWTPPSSGVIDGYRVFRSTDGTNFTQIKELYNGSDANPAWQDTTALDGQKYWYRVRPFTYAAGSAHTTNKMSSPTQMNRPINVRATRTSNGRANIVWTNASSSAQGFRVYQIVAGQALTQIAELGASASSFTTDDTLQDGARYTFFVQAFNREIDSGLSDPAILSSSGVTINVPSQVSEGTAARFSLAGYVAPAGGSAIYWEFGKAGRPTITANGEQVDWVPSDDGTYTAQAYEVTAGSSKLLDTVPVRVANVAPLQVSIVGNLNGRPGQTLALRTPAIDPAGSSDVLSYQWVVRDAVGTALEIAVGRSDQRSFAFKIPTTLVANTKLLVELNVSDGDGGLTRAQATAFVSPAQNLSQRFELHSAFDEVCKIYVQQDGKVLVGGLIRDPSGTVSGQRVVIVRLNPDLTPDTSFGYAGLGLAGGVVDTPLTIPDGIGSIAVGRLGFEQLFDVRPDGRIVVLGTADASDWGFSSVISAAQIMPDGKSSGISSRFPGADASFGVGGVAFAFAGTPYGLEPWAANDNAPQAISLDPQGRILILSRKLAAGDSDAGSRFMLARLNAEGQLDIGERNAQGATIHEGFGSKYSIDNPAPGAEFPVAYDMGLIRRGFINPTFTSVGFGDENQGRTVQVAPDGRVVIGLGSTGLSYGTTNSASAYTIATDSGDWVGYRTSNGLPPFTDSADGDSRDFYSTVRVVQGSENIGTSVSASIIEPTLSGEWNVVALSNSWPNENDSAAYAAPGYIRLHRINSSGQIDRNWGPAGSNGVVRLQIKAQNGGLLSGYSIRRNADGSYLVVGGEILSYTGTLSGDTFVAKITSSGMLDTTFGNGGVLWVDLGATTPGNPNVGDSGRDVYLDPYDGSLIVAGTSELNNHNWVVQRVYPNNNGKAHDLIASAQEDGSIQLNWIDEARGEAYFAVERSSVDPDLAGFQPAFWQRIDNASSGSEEYIDRDVEGDTQYWYRVGTADDASMRAWSNTASATAVATDTSYAWSESVVVPINGTSVSTSSLQNGVRYRFVARGQLNLGGSGLAFRADAEYGYYLPADVTAWDNSQWVGHGNIDYGISINDPVIDQNKSPKWDAPAQSSDNTYTTPFVGLGQPAVLRFHDDYYADNALIPGWRVDIFRALPATPKSLSATPVWLPNPSNRSQKAIDIAWAGPSRADRRYEVYRDGGSGWVQIGVVPGTEQRFRDSGAVGGLDLNKLYQYRVRAVDEGGESPFSSSVPAMLANRLPVVNAVADVRVPLSFTDLQGNVTPGGSWVPVVAVDPEDERIGLHYQLVAPTTLPTGVSIIFNEGMQRLEVQLSAGASLGEVPIEFAVTDDQRFALGTPATDTATWSRVKFKLIVVPNQADAPFMISPYTVYDGPEPTPPPETNPEYYGSTVAKPIAGQPTKVRLSAKAGPAGGGLRYTWSVVNLPYGAQQPDFGPANGTSNAASIDVTLREARSYGFMVTVSKDFYNADGSKFTLSTRGYTNAYNAGAYPTALEFYDGDVSVSNAAGASNLVFLRAIDQFGEAMAPDTSLNISWADVDDPSQPVLFTAGPNILSRSISANASTKIGNHRIRATLTASGSTYTADAVVNVIQDASDGGPVVTGVKVQRSAPYTYSLEAVAVDDGGASNLSYQWGVLSGPVGAPAAFFSRNTSAEAATTTVSNLIAGTYVLSLTVRDAVGRVADYTVPGFVVQSETTATPVLSGLRLTAGAMAVGTNRTSPLSIAPLDQFGRQMSLPSGWTVTWSMGGNAGGSLLASPPALGNTYTSPTSIAQLDANAVITATATNGTNTFTDRLTIRVANNLPLEAVLVSPIRKSDPQELDRETPVRIVARDPNGVASPARGIKWSLNLIPRTSGVQSTTPMLLASGTGPVSEFNDAGAVAGYVRPGQIDDGLYRIELRVEYADDPATAVTDGRDIIVRNAVKLGNLVLPFQDLRLTAPDGSEFALDRVYDSGAVSQSGDFGYGWTLDTKSATVKTTARPGKFAAKDQAGTVDYGALRASNTNSDLVFVNLPGGGNFTFAFLPKPDNYNQANSRDVYGPASPYYFFKPRFMAVDGSGATLTVNNTIQLTRDRGTGEFFDRLSGKGYNPALSHFGGEYLLTTSGGLKYRINAKTGTVIERTDRAGNATTVTSGSVDTFAFGADYTVRLEREASGAKRVTSAGVYDASGTLVGSKIDFKYTVDPLNPSSGDAGILTGVVGRDGGLTKFVYEASAVGEPARYLTGIIDPRGIKVVSARFDHAAGHKLVEMKDGRQTAAGISSSPFNGASAAQGGTDARGNSTELIHDSRGNVVREIRGMRNDAGAIVKYVVSVKSFEYLQGVGWDLFTSDETNVNQLARVTEYEPFEVVGDDTAGLRYAREPESIRTQTNYGVNDLPGNASSGKVVSTTVRLSDGTYRSVGVGDYNASSGESPRTTVDLDGKASYSEFDSNGLLQWTIGANGEGTRYVYETDAALPKGLVKQTFRVRVSPSVAPGTRPTTAQLQDIDPSASSTNTYYTATNASAGAVRGLVATTKNATDVVTRYTYEPDGQLRATYISWPGQAEFRTQLNEYTSGSRRLWRTTDAFGSTTETYYTPLGKVDHTIDSFGRQTTMTYDALGQLIRTTYPDATESRTAYDVLGRAEWTTDRFVIGAATVRLTRSLFDGLGRSIGSESYRDGMISLGSETIDGVTFSKTSSPDAATLTAAGKRLGVTSTTYDSQGRTNRQVDVNGVATTTTYRPDGSPAATTREAGSLSATTSSEQDTWGGFTFKPTGSYRTGDKIRFVLSKLGTATTLTVDVTATSESLSALRTAVVSAFTAQSGNALLQGAVVEIAGESVVFRNTNASSPLELSIAASTIQATSNALLSSPSFERVPTNHSVKSVDAEGKITINVRDSEGREWRTYFHDGSFTETLTAGAGMLLSSSPYVPTPPQIEALRPTVGSTVTPRGVIPPSSLQFFGSHVVKIAQRKAGETSVATHYLYDRFGRLTDVFLPPVADFDGGNAMTWAQWHYTYDLNGNQLTQQDPKGRVTYFDYDQFGRRTARWLPGATGRNTSDPADDQFVERWTFDGRGRTKTHVDFKKQTTAYLYGDNLPASDTVRNTPANKDRLMAEYRYAAGTAVVINADGSFNYAAASERTEYYYNAKGERTEVREYPSGTGTTNERITTYEFDAVTGGETKVSSPEGTIHREFNAVDGSLLRMWTATTPASTTAINDTRYTYDDFGRLETVTAAMLNGVAPIAKTTVYRYNSVGQQTQVIYPNQSLTEYTFDDLHRLTGSATKILNASGVYQPRFTQVYQLETDGQRKSVLEKRFKPDSSLYSTTRITLDYDAQDRLVRETRDENDDGVSAGADYIADYQFDLVGNRREKIVDRPADQIDETTTSVFNVRDQLSSDTAVAGGSTTTTGYDYDLNGSTQSVSVNGSLAKTYLWDLRNRLAQQDVNGNMTPDAVGDQIMSYDHTGARVATAAWSASVYDPETGDYAPGILDTRYLQDLQNPSGYSQVVETWVEDQLNTSYVIGSRVIEQARTSKSSAPEFLMYDVHGSVRGVLDGANSSSRLAEWYDFDAYGSRIAFRATLSEGSTYTSSRTESTSASRLLYAGELFDSVHMAYVNRARYYIPQLGRFSSFDAFEGSSTSPSDLHKYRYANANPAIFLDPTGNYSVLETLCSVAKWTTIATTMLHVGVVAAVSAAMGDLPDHVGFGVFGAIGGEGPLGWSAGGVAGAELVLSPRKKTWALYGFGGFEPIWTPNPKAAVSETLDVSSHSTSRFHGEVGVYEAWYWDGPSEETVGWHPFGIMGLSAPNGLFAGWEVSQGATALLFGRTLRSFGGHSEQPSGFGIFGASGGLIGSAPLTKTEMVLTAAFGETAFSLLVGEAISKLTGGIGGKLSLAASVINAGMVSTWVGLTYGR